MVGLPHEDIGEERKKEKTTLDRRGKQIKRGRQLWLYASLSEDVEPRVMAAWLGWDDDRPLVAILETAKSTRGLELNVFSVRSCFALV